MRVVLAEDHILLRDGLALLLTSHGFDLVATVDSGPDLLGRVARTPARRRGRRRPPASHVH